jgi:hypothetical protein
MYDGTGGWPQFLLPLNLILLGVAHVRPAKQASVGVLGL